MYLCIVRTDRSIHLSFSSVKYRYTIVNYTLFHPYGKGIKEVLAFRTHSDTCAIQEDYNKGFVMSILTRTGTCEIPRRLQQRIGNPKLCPPFFRILDE